MYLNVFGSINTNERVDFIMEREQFVAAGIDYEQAINRFMNNQAMYEKFLVRFPNDKSYEELKAAVSAGDCEAAFKAAHTLKGVSANLAMEELTKAASAATEEFRAGNFEQGVALIPQVDEKYSQIAEFISQL